jgi:branched-chain amino acid transport system permease protein
MLDLDVLIRIFIYGASLGGVWALIASGFTLIFGVSRILNFAHGAFFILGAYAGIVLIWSFGLDPYTSTLIGMVLVGLLAAAAYKGIMSPVRQHEVMVIIVTLALALFLEELVLLTFGEYGISFPKMIGGVTFILGVPIPNIRLFTLVIALLALALLGFFINRTRLGREITAASQDAEAATLTGMNIETLFTITIFISAILAALGGSLHAQIYAAHPVMALKALIFAFAIVILGGLGSIKGSIIAAFIVGYILATVIILYGAHWAELVAILIIIAILILRPAGLFGVKE